MGFKERYDNTAAMWDRVQVWEQDQDIKTIPWESFSSVNTGS